MKDIKALIFDLDGTAIPNGPDGMPSERVLHTVTEVSKLITVGCATGREIQICRHIIETLDLNAPCIIAGGSQIVNQSNFSIMWEQTLSPELLQEIVDRCKQFPYVMMNDGDTGPDVYIADYRDFVTKPIIFIINVPKENASELITVLESIKDIAVHTVTAWTEGNVDLHITHKDASKKHALRKWLEMQNIQSAEVMVVGDSGNDLPLFELAGLKIAMGNASQELKNQADWVAPSVSEDGLAVAIEKYILT